MRCDCFLQRKQSQLRMTQQVALHQDRDVPSRSCPRALGQVLALYEMQGDAFPRECVVGQFRIGITSSTSRKRSCRSPE